MASVKIYFNSVPATILSIVATVSFISGVGMLFNKNIIGGIVLIVLACACWYFAEKISAKKAEKNVEKKKKKYAEDINLSEKLSASCLEALNYFQLFPTEEGFEMVKRCNPYAASQIQRVLDNEITYDQLHLDFRLSDMGNKKAGDVVLSGSLGDVEALSEKYEADMKKYNKLRLVKNVFCIAFIPVIISGFFIGINYKPDKEFVKYSYETAENTYIAVDIVAIQACGETFNDTLGGVYECVFVTDDGYTGIITIPKGDYDDEAMKDVIAAMSDVTLEVEPVRFYGNTTMAVSSAMEEWVTANGFILEQLAPVRIIGSRTPEKGVSAVGMTIAGIGAFLAIVAFVLALTVNMKKNKLAGFANRIEFLKKQRADV